MSRSSNNNGNTASRDERLRAALRANLAKRKAQGRARAAEAEAQEQGDEDTPEQEK